MCRGLVWNDAAVYGGSMGLKILVRYSSEILNSLKSDSDMIVLDPLMCWKCRYTSLLIRVHTNHCDTMSWSSSLTGSDEDLYIHTRALELSAIARM